MSRTIRKPLSAVSALAVMLTGACGGLGPTSDGAAPLVSFDIPRQGDVVSGTVQITVQSVDDFGVAAVRIFVDGNQIAEDISSPYQGIWNTASLQDGTSHTLRAESRDFAGNVGVAQVTVTVQNNPN
ncbi:MAG: Ig-like domain-containing protein [Gemmatimonadales bacterium]